MAQDFIEYRGDTSVLTLTFKKADGTAQPITGWTVFLTLKTNKLDPDANALVSKTITSHADPTNGITIITIAASETINLLGKYFYDIQYKTDLGVIKTVLDGTYQFLEDVTKRIV